MNFVMKFFRFSIFPAIVILLIEIPINSKAKSSQKNVISDIVDIKDFKKLLRTKNNVLTLFVNSPKRNASVFKVFEDTAEQIKGQGTMVFADCSNEAKKLCKKLKVSPDPFLLKHYKDGEFHKNYDRKFTVLSMLNFMRDPTGEIPWDEDSTTNGIVHISDPPNLSKFLKKEMGPVMIMFYAPWCGFCKQLKPEYAAAALELKGHSTLAAVDVNKPENMPLRNRYNITGFPTLIYFENGVKMYIYEGENNKESLVSFMKNPTSTPVKPVEVAWSESETEVQHLTDETFEDSVKDTESILVMFYAPWCGHCKKLKPEYEKAAEKLKKNKINGVLAGLDATKETKTAKKFNVNGYPTLKYFKNGEFQFDVNLREETELVNFMINPKKPPPPPPPEKLWSEEESEVIHLTTESFKPVLRRKKHALVMFYAPWCGHCKKAKPEFTASAEFFKDNSKIAFAAVDCTLHQSVCSSYNVKGYPTIKLFHYLNKEPVEDYSGGRKQNDFTTYMKKFLKQSHLNNQIELPKNDSKSEELEKKPLLYNDWNKIDNSDLILHLTDTNFDYSLKKHDFLLVFFYKSGCLECETIKKEYSHAALMVENRKLSGKLAAYNASVHKKISKEKDISVFPIIQFYRKGVLTATYSGKYVALEIFNFFKKSHTRNKDEL